jgi:hypothetical protein
MRAKFMYEELGFERSGDVKKTLGIGKKEIIERGFKELEERGYDWTMYIAPNWQIKIESPGEEIDGTGLRILPQGFYKANSIVFNVDGDIYFPQLKELPPNVTFKGTEVWLHDIEHIPENTMFDLERGSRVYLNNISLKEFNENEHHNVEFNPGINLYLKGIKFLT